MVEKKEKEGEVSKKGEITEVFFTRYGGFAGIPKFTVINWKSGEILSKKEEDRPPIVSIEERRSFEKLLYNADFFQIRLQLQDRWIAREDARERGETSLKADSFLYNIAVRTDPYVYSAHITDAEIRDFPNLQPLIEWLITKSSPILKK